MDSTIAARGPPPGSWNRRRGPTPSSERQKISLWGHYPNNRPGGLCGQELRHCYLLAWTSITAGNFAQVLLDADFRRKRPERKESTGLLAWGSL